MYSLQAFLYMLNVKSDVRGDAHKAEWSRLKNELMIEVPQDYTTLVDAIGAGCFNNFLWLYSPFCTNQFLEFEYRLKTTEKFFRNMSQVEQLPSEILPFFWYPAPDGLVSWGGTDNGDLLLWSHDGRGAAHSVIVVCSRDLRWFNSGLGILEFLQRVLSGDLKVPLFPASFPGGPPSFKAWTER
jgi:hypothetical protein